MSKITLAVLLAASLNAQADPKILSYQFNQNVVIFISDAKCVHAEHAAKFPNAAAAIRVDGKSLSGCFTHDKDDIVIQWNRGDQTRLPANAFLVGQPKATL